MISLGAGPRVDGSRFCTAKLYHPPLFLFTANDNHRLSAKTVTVISEKPQAIR
jgi:hypothetical protein